MGTTTIKTYEDVTIVTAFDYNDNMEAEIVDSDNNNPSCYLAGIDYYIRLYLGYLTPLLSAKINSGSISLLPGLNQESISGERITFTGIKTISAARMISSGFTYSKRGLVFKRSDHAEYTKALSYTIDSKTIRAETQIFGIYEINYTSLYRLYKFRVNSSGDIIISFRAGEE